MSSKADTHTGDGAHPAAIAQAIAQAMASIAAKTSTEPTASLVGLSAEVWLKGLQAGRHGFGVAEMLP